MTIDLTKQQSVRTHRYLVNPVLFSSDRSLGIAKSFSVSQSVRGHLLESQLNYKTTQNISYQSTAETPQTFSNLCNHLKPP